MPPKNNNNNDLVKQPFEAALTSTGFGLYNYRLTILTGLCIVSFACVVYCSTIIVPASSCELGTSEAQKGLIVGAPLIGTILGAALWGYLADQRGRRTTLMASLLSGAAVCAVASLSVNWIMLMLLQFLASLLASGQFSLAMTLLSESVPLPRRNVVVLVVTSIFLLSLGLMSVLAIPITPLRFSYHLPLLGIYWNSWRTLLLIFSTPSLISAACVYFVEESPKYVFSKGDEEGAMEILRKIHRINRRSLADLQIKGILTGSTQDQITTLSTTQQFTSLFRPPLLKYFVIMTTLSVFLQIGSFVIWLPRIANQFVGILETGEGMNLTLCGVIDASIKSAQENTCLFNTKALLIVFGISALQSIANAIISLGVGRLGRRNMAIGVAAICGISGLLINVVPHAVGSGVLFVLFTVGMLLVGLYTAISVTLFPTSLRAVAMSLAMTGGRLATFGAVQIINRLFRTNCELGFYLFSAIIVASAVVASFLPDDRYLDNLHQNTPGKENNALDRHM